VPSYAWDFSPIWRNADLLLAGLANTIWLSAASIAVGLAIGLGLAILRLSHSRLLSAPAGALIEFYRNTPPLVHFFWYYYGLPILLGVSLSPFAAALLALSVQSGAFFAEVFRGGIVSIERGQWEAGRALGMSRRQLMRRIILPQAVRRMVPPLMERSFEVVKTTALAATLAYSELLYQAMTLASRSYRPLETYSAVALIFFLLLLTASLAMRQVEARLRIGQP
jgi:polar amino acid transport system permease protein